MRRAASPGIRGAGYVGSPLSQQCTQGSNVGVRRLRAASAGRSRREEGEQALASDAVTYHAVRMECHTGKSRMWSTQGKLRQLQQRPHSAQRLAQEAAQLSEHRDALRRERDLLRASVHPPQSVTAPLPPSSRLPAPLQRPASAMR